MNPTLFTLKALRKIYRKIAHLQFPDPDCVLDRAAANELILAAITSGNPLMVSRIGAVESGCLSHYLMLKDSRNFLTKAKLYVGDNFSAPIWDPEHLAHLCADAGFFPARRELFDRFCELYLTDIPQIDILGSMNYAEKVFPLAPECRKIHLETLAPLLTEHPWSRALAGKRVVVVHPFADTIKSQYARREKLFANPDVLPEFELTTMRAVQSIGGEGGRFATWFDALRYMEDEIDRLDYDIALLGCGAYGLPLAAHIKRQGKQAIHIGGALQLLFGIRGKRWEENYRWTYKTPRQLAMNYRDLFNEFWVRPQPQETPEAAKKVENGCYW